ncbi:fatty-acid amide hydrolase 2-A-like [Homalodisca vitripennis]|uniref:fatty-acid amide hydrolase 2-A-like n=1 Tax=Homalodisca vitripennis TaxID=197043 RepID=UPI001EEB5525|nr:fatty-acid amide hydrolase 2-A-like [Homalodisca vitripennis]
MELFLWVLTVIKIALCRILDPFYWLLSKLETTVPLQPIRNNILTMSASQLAAKIRTGEISCEEVMQLYIFRCRRVDMKLNAVVENRYAAAVEEAEKVDALIASNTKTIKELEEELPLLGVPISVKECCKLKGMSYSVGCRIRVGKKADKDGTAVELLRKSGAIPIAVTNQSEMCLSTETYNSVCGLTRNPYNIQRTVGGASGGEAALVSSAGTVAGIGCDLFGSVRCPAMFTSIYGHRPTPGIVSVEGHYPEESSEQLTDHLVLGPITRYSEDLPLMMTVMAGNQAAKLKLHQKVNLKDLKVFYMTEAGSSLNLPSVDEEIKLAIQKAVDYLQTTCKCGVQKAEFTEFKNSQEISRAVLFNLKNIPDVLNENKSIYYKKSQDLWNEILKSFIGQSAFSLMALTHSFMNMIYKKIPAEKTQLYIRQNENLKEKLIEALGEDGVLILPTYPTAAHYHYQSLIRKPGDCYCTIITSLGLPATNIPMGLNKKGLPIGFQVIAAPYQDRLCFAVAQELERAFGGWVQPPCLQTPTDS